MSKKSSPAMEGGVSRAVDFNLKKEDLMLLILEGRKENMEEEIGKIQTVSTDLREKIKEAQAAFKKKVSKLCAAIITPEAKKIAKAFSTVSEDEEDMRQIESDEDSDDINLGESFVLNIGHHIEHHEYTKYASRPIGDGKGSTYVKQQERASETLSLYSSMEVNMKVSLYGKTFVKPDSILRNKDVRACGEYSRDFTIINESLNLETQRELPEYKKLLGLVKDLTANESLLSDILAEYDLFNRNQPRAKAKMIKEVLARDESGQALLDNIMTAASGVKLIAPVKEKA